MIKQLIKKIIAAINPPTIKPIVEITTPVQKETSKEVKVAVGKNTNKPNPKKQYTKRKPRGIE